MSGQDITLEIEKRKGCKPSPGTIYPALKALSEAGLVSEEKEGKVITYSLTKEGKNAFEDARKQFCRTFTDVF